MRHAGFRASHSARRGPSLHPFPPAGGLVFPLPRAGSTARAHRAGSRRTPVGIMARQQETPEKGSQWPFSEHPLRRVVVKVGSNVLALPEGGLNVARVGELADMAALARRRGVEIIIVTSGAVAAGRGVLAMRQRPTALPDLQAVAAIGQCALMEAYANAFRRHGFHAAQVLLNRDDMDDRRRYLNARNAMISLLEKNAVPVVNENDTVTVEELKFGDNDMLSAMVAAKMDADLLVILTNVPGLMSGHPEKDPGARLIPWIEKITPAVEALVTGGNSEHGTGGMATKLQAARHATQFGVACVIADGTTEGQLGAVLGGDFQGTLFTASATRRAGSSRRHWIYSRRVKGELTIDDGAATALLHAGKSLLAVGITEVTGSFGKGDIVRISDGSGTDLARGITNYDSGALRLMRGKKTAQLAREGLALDYPEVVHRDNMALS